MIQVLIVDDEKLEREGIKYLLAMEEGEWNIREASNGRDALQITEKMRRQTCFLRILRCPTWTGWSLPQRQKN